MSIDAGLTALPTAYRTLFENDVHAPGSVDRVLWDGMTKIGPETIPTLYSTPDEPRYRRGQREVLDALVDVARPACDRVQQVVDVCADVVARDPGGDMETWRFGGTEEQILERGTDWCVDVARVACALAQVAGLPARMVLLVNPDAAYSGHQIVEAYRDDRWGALDPATSVVYAHPDGTPASAFDLMSSADLVRRHWRGDATPYTTPRQFGFAAVVGYDVADASAYDYSVSGLNDYYRSILSMASEGWPGGLRWLHGEDRVVGSG